MKKLTLVVLLMLTGVVLGAPLVDPLDAPAESVGRVTELWRSGAIPATIIVLAFFVLQILRNRVQWFSEHSRAAWISAAIGGLAVAVDGIQRGETPNASMLIIAVTTTLAQLQRMPPKGGA